MKEVVKLSEQETLVSAIKRNDTAVLEQLYISNYPKAQSYVLKNSGSIDEARDVYQEAFIAMYRNVYLDKFVPKGETALQGYLYRIVSNKWLDVLRSSRKKHTIRADFSPLSTALVEIDNEDEEQLQLMKNGIKKLSDNCKHILESFYFKSMSLREIAAQSNIGEASARNKKYRCMEELKSIIKNLQN